MCLVRVDSRSLKLQILVPREECGRYSECCAIISWTGSGVGCCRTSLKSGLNAREWSSPARPGPIGRPCGDRCFRVSRPYPLRAFAVMPRSVSANISKALISTRAGAAVPTLSVRLPMVDPRANRGLQPPNASGKLPLQAVSPPGATNVIASERRFQERQPFNVSPLGPPPPKPHFQDQNITLSSQPPRLEKRKEMCQKPSVGHPHETAAFRPRYGSRMVSDCRTLNRTIYARSFQSHPPRSVRGSENRGRWGQDLGGGSDKTSVLKTPD